MRFVNFVNRVLILNKVQTLSRFCLICDESSCEEFHISTRLSSVIERNVEQLELSFNRGINDSIYLPQNLFSGCKHLVILKLNRGILLNVTSSVDFPSLKVLHLKSAWFSHEDSLSVLLSGCSLLEVLVINYNDPCLPEHSDSTSRIRACISGLSKLKSLELRLYSWVQDSRVEIEAPLLEKLYLQDGYQSQYLVGDLSKLKTATLMSLYEDVLTLLKGVQHVNFLILDIFKPVPNEHLPIFGNLVRLELVAWSGFNFVLSLLEKTLLSCSFLFLTRLISKKTLNLAGRNHLLFLLVCLQP